MARPNKSQVIINQIRDKDIFQMHQKNYPRDYIAMYFQLTESAISKIIKKQLKTAMPQIDDTTIAITVDNDDSDSSIDTIEATKGKQYE